MRELKLSLFYGFLIKQNIITASHVRYKEIENSKWTRIHAETIIIRDPALFGLAVIPFIQQTWIFIAIDASQLSAVLRCQAD